MLRTARCVLLPPSGSDVGFIAALYTDLRVREHLGGPVDPRVAIDNARGFVAGTKYHHVWIARLEQDSRFCGVVMLGSHYDGQDIEISYLFDPAFWGTGVAGESVAAVLEHARIVLRINRIIAETQAVNTSSRKLLERCGLHQVASLQRFGADQLIYSNIP